MASFQEMILKYVRFEILARAAGRASGFFFANLLALLPVVLWRGFGTGICRGWFSPYDELSVHLVLMTIISFVFWMRSEDNLNNFKEEEGVNMMADLEVD